MVRWFILAAILSEVTGTIAIRFSDGFAKLVPSVAGVVGVAGGYIMFSQALKLGMPVGVAYAIWSAGGMALVALIGAVFIGDQLTWVQWTGLVLIIGGVGALQLGGASAG